MIHGRQWCDWAATRSLVEQRDEQITATQQEEKLIERTEDSVARESWQLVTFPHKKLQNPTLSVSYIFECMSLCVSPAANQTPRFVPASQDLKHDLCLYFSMFRLHQVFANSSQNWQKRLWKETFICRRMITVSMKFLTHMCIVLVYILVFWIN